MADPVNLKKVADNKQSPHRRITEEMVMRSRLREQRPPNPYVIPSFPPVVERALEQAVKEQGVRTLAMDQDVNDNFGWASNGLVNLNFNEGVAFMGYSYLAALAQRAEYRVVSETIAAEMTREFIELKIASGDEAKNDLKKFIEDQMDNLDVRHVFRQIAEQDGFFGRAHLYIDTGMTSDADELITDLGDGRSVMSRLKVGPNKNQKLIRLQPVEAMWVYPTYYESLDPLKESWYRPTTWYCMSREIHRSRLLTFVSRPVPDILKPAYSFGGLSMTQMLKPYVDNWLRTRQSVSDLVQAFSFNVLRTNLDASTGAGGDQLWQRIALFNNIKNNQGTLVIDKDAEDWSNVAVPVGTLDHLQAQAQEHMAAISRIPLVKLLGIQPAGLNASSEGELNSFEDWVASFQETLFRPALRTIIDLIQLTAFGQIDDDIQFDFKPLRQLKPIEEAQLQSVIAQTREGYFQMGAVDAQEVREALAEDNETPFEGLDLSKPLPQPPSMPGMPEMPGMPPPPGGGGGGPPGHSGGPGGGGMQPPHLPQPPKPPAPPSPSTGGGETDGDHMHSSGWDDGEEVEAIPLEYAERPFDEDPFEAQHRAFMGAADAEFKEENVKRDEEGKFAEQEGGAAATAEPLKGSKPGSHAATIASRNPTKTEAGVENVPREPDNYNRADLDGMKRDPERYAFNMNLLRNGNHYANLRPEETEGKTPDQIARAAIDHAKANLKFLYEHAPKDVREQGHEWYEGAHNLCAEQAKRYDLPLQTIVGVYAALSPQKLWDMNVHLAERMLDIYKNAQNAPWSDNMERAAQEKIAKAGAGKTKGMTAEQAAAREAKAKERKNREFAAIRGKTLGQLDDPKDKALWIAIHDEATQWNEAGDKVNTMSFNRLSPDGRKLDTYRNKDGKATSAVWQTRDIGANAVRALESGGDRAKLSAAMGGEHKVRSFYNNILDPASDNGDVTMDTHAVGAALLRALGGTDVPVAHSLGTEPKNGNKPADWVAAKGSSISGASGTYGLWADAYRELAAELDPPIPPRVLQSITWEAKRRLFDEDMAKDIPDKVEAVWHSYHDGHISLSDAQQQVLTLAGGMEGKRLSGTPAKKEEKSAEPKTIRRPVTKRRVGEHAGD
jgi:phage-related protein (TIGR01555 family)